ncbi:MAG: hypothetical protein ACYC35_27340 [Pirellulales bacterium]
MRHRFNAVVFSGAHVQRLLPLRLPYGRALRWLAQFAATHKSEDGMLAGLVPYHPEQERGRRHA